MQRGSYLNFLPLFGEGGLSSTQFFPYPEVHLRRAPAASRHSTLRLPGNRNFAARRGPMSFGNGIAAAIPLQRPVLEGTPSL